MQPLSQEASEHQTEVTQHRHPHLWPTGSPVLRCPMFMDSGYDGRLDRRELLYVGQGDIEENLLEEGCCWGPTLTKTPPARVGAWGTEI